MKTNDHSPSKLKLVVIGGTGLIGRTLVATLRDRGHDVVAASPSTGVNAVTGAGLLPALTGADVVVDVSNSPSFEDQAVMDFFEQSTRNLLEAEKAVGVKHHVALSVVGTERMQGGGYFRAKLKQETLIGAGSVPFTIVRATQFFEFVPAIAQIATAGQTVRLSRAQMQPVGAGDVAAFLADIALAAPLNGTVEIAGPEPIRQDELVRRFLKSTGDARTVVADDHALYFGIVAVDDQSLTPGPAPRLGAARFEDWLGLQPVRK